MHFYHGSSITADEDVIAAFYQSNQFLKSVKSLCNFHENLHLCPILPDPFVEHVIEYDIRRDEGAMFEPSLGR